MSETFTLEEVDVHQFRRDGVLVVRNLFKPDQIETLVNAWSEARQAIMNNNNGQLKRVDRFVFGRLPSVIQNVYANEELVHAIKQLLGCEDIALYMSRLLIKDQSWNGAVENHQDMPAFHGSLNKISAFVPLLPHNEATGGLKVVKGSHHYGNLGIMGTIYTDQFPPMEILSPSLEVGDVMFVDFLTWHYSEAATVESDRPLLQIAYQPADDGSFYELDGPTLVSGQWKTNYFTRHGYGVKRNELLPGEGEIAKSLGLRVEKLTADLEETTSRLQDAEHELELLRKERNQVLQQLQVVESSKFWKVRTAWVKFREAVGLAE